MRVRIYRVDAFAYRGAGGNPAAVVPVPEFPADDVMQALALENDVSETAFLVRDDAGWALRWFTPTTEVPFCGHATLASACVVTMRLDAGADSVAFRTRSGLLSVRRKRDRFAMDAPARTMRSVAGPRGLAEALGAIPLEVLHDGFNYVALLDSATRVRELRPDIAAIARIEAAGVVVTAVGDEGFDCVSRYFAPAKGIDEDPVTGGAHCALGPFWAERMGKPEIRGFQASARGGEIVCRPLGERVELEGACVFSEEGGAEI